MRHFNTLRFIFPGQSEMSNATSYGYNSQSISPFILLSEKELREDCDTEKQGKKTTHKKEDGKKSGMRD